MGAPPADHPYIGVRADTEVEAIAKWNAQARLLWKEIQGAPKSDHVCGPILPEQPRSET